MVDFDLKRLDRTFAALADPTRRAMLQRVADEPGIPASKLAEPFDMSLPAAMKHLGVLEQAGLLVRNKVGRTVHYSLLTTPMQDAIAWLETYARFWSERLDALADYLEEDACPQPAKSEAALPASRSSGASRPVRNASGKRGPRERR